MIYSPKQIGWVFPLKGSILLQTTTPLHQYTIFYDEQEKQFRVNYHEHITNESGYCHKPTLSKCIHWVESEHFPSKLLRWFNKV